MPLPRTLNLLIFIATLGLMAVALFMQHVWGLTPCYLCIVQRLFVILTGLIALAAFIHNPGRKGLRLYGAATCVSALVGAGFSIRQLWLQSLPENLVPACGPPAEYLFDALPLMEALPMLLSGDGNCAEVQWSLFGISIPGYTLIAFAGLALLGSIQALRREPQAH